MAFSKRKAYFADKLLAHNKHVLQSNAQQPKESKRAAVYLPHPRYSLFCLESRTLGKDQDANLFLQDIPKQVSLHSATFSTSSHVLVSTLSPLVLPRNWYSESYSLHQWNRTKHLILEIVHKAIMSSRH